MGEAGYVDGRNVTIEFSWAEEDRDNRDALEWAIDVLIDTALDKST